MQDISCIIWYFRLKRGGQPVQSIEIFTRSPQALHGVSHIVVSPEHYLTTLEQREASFRIKVMHTLKACKYVIEYAHLIFSI